MSYQSFTDLVQERSLCFVRPKLWEDPYEGYLFQKLKTESGQKVIRDLLDSQFASSFVRDLFFDLALEFERIFYAQSWSLCSDSDAMWRIYSFDNKAIRIEISESSIAKLPNVEILNVSYENHIDLLTELTRVGLGQNRTDFSEIFRIKRKAFAHEEEVRLIFKRNEAVNEKSDEEVAQFAKALTGTDLEGVLPEIVQKSRDTVRISYAHVPSFFDSICLHPQAPDWFNGTVKKYCETNGLPYIGKSKLYENVV